MISWDYSFIYIGSLFRLSLSVYVADKYVNDQIHLYHDPSSFSLPLYTALKYATGLLQMKDEGLKVKCPLIWKGESQKQIIKNKWVKTENKINKILQPIVVQL